MLTILNFCELCCVCGQFVDASLAAIQRQKMDYSNPDVNQEEAKKLWESLLSEPSPSDEELVSAVKKGQ